MDNNSLLFYRTKWLVIVSEAKIIQLFPISVYTGDIEINEDDRKNILEDEIGQLKLKLYEKQFELSEIKNVIRKNCSHEWKANDIEMGHTFFNESKCTKCDAVNDFEELELV